MRRLLLIGAALLSLALPGLADAATTTTPSVGVTSSPFSVGVPQVTETTTTTTPTVAATSSTTATNGSFGAVDAIGIGAAVVVVIIAVVFFVLRDSRKAARHIRGSTAPATAGVRAGSKAPPRSRKLSVQEKKRRKRGRAPRRR